MNSAIRTWADWAVSQGWTVGDDASGYTHFFNPEGAWVARYPATASNEYRRLLDLKVALKRAGLQIPAPSKKERRSQRRKGR